MQRRKHIHIPQRASGFTTLFVYLIEKWREGRNHSKKHPILSWMVRRLKGLEDPQKTSFHALMNCSSTQKADTSKPFLSISLIWPCHPPDAPIWSAARVCSLNIFLTPFSSKGGGIPKSYFPFRWVAWCASHQLLPFPTSRGWKTAYRRVLWHLISSVGLFHKHFYHTHHFSSVILCTTSLQLLHSKRQQSTRSYWKSKKVVLKHHLLLQVTMKKKWKPFFLRS